MPHATTHLLYLHGFRSSPRSAKAQQMAQWMAAHRPDVHFWCPQLPPSPREAMALVAQGIADWPAQRMAVVGSSLGGFYASWVAQQKPGCTSVVLNPAVDPARDLERYIGEQTAWHDPAEHFYFRPEYIAELRALDVRGLPPAGRKLAIIAKGDELLDWREMAARHAGAQVRLLEGGDHALSTFPDHIGEVVAFCGLVE